MWFDMMAIPKDAKHPNNAHLFLNYMMRPEVMAGSATTLPTPTPTRRRRPLVDKAITENPSIYPTPEAKTSCSAFAVLPPDVDRLYTRIWTELKTGK